MGVVGRVARLRCGGDVGGIAAGIRRLRLAALAIIGLTAAKVFLVDMAGLVGLWRVLSFLGLGLVLIGLGAAYRRLVVPPPQQQA